MKQDEYGIGVVADRGEYVAPVGDVSEKLYLHIGALFLGVVLEADAFWFPF